MAPHDRVRLAGRDPERDHAATAAIASGQPIARVVGHVLDVRDGDAIASLATELAEVDIVFSNAASRVSPDVDLPTRSTPSPRPTTSRRRPCCASSPRACPARAAGRREGCQYSVSSCCGEVVRMQETAEWVASLELLDSGEPGWWRRWLGRDGRAAAERSVL
jgi:NAD(P)-dependent dehydrogenase (short-subunit alcohol dehydrogenase family)